MTENDYILVSTLTRLRACEDALLHCLPHEGCPDWTEGISVEVSRKIARARQWFEDQVEMASE